MARGGAAAGVDYNTPENQDIWLKSFTTGLKLPYVDGNIGGYADAIYTKGAYPGDPITKTNGGCEVTTAGLVQGLLFVINDQHFSKISALSGRVTFADNLLRMSLTEFMLYETPPPEPLKTTSYEDRASFDAKALNFTRISKIRELMQEDLLSLNEFGYVKVLLDLLSSEAEMSPVEYSSSPEEGGSVQSVLADTEVGSEVGSEADQAESRKRRRSGGEEQAEELSADEEEHDSTATGLDDDGGADPLVRGSNPLTNLEGATPKFMRTKSPTDELLGIE